MASESFLIEEYKSLDNRMHFVRSDMARFETIGFAAILGFYSWFSSNTPDDVLSVIPAAISIYGLARLRWRLEIVKKYECYMRQIEDELLRDVSLVGYENFYSQNDDDRFWRQSREVGYWIVIFATSAYALWIIFLAE